MARRKSEAKQEEEFIQGVMGLTGFGSLGGTYLLTKSIQISLIVFAIAVVIVTAALIIRKKKHEERLKKSGIADIDKMEGIQFEHYLGHLFRAQGYKVEITKAVGDYGADLVIQKDKKIVVQAKRYSKNVGIKAVQEAKSSIAHYGAVEAWVVTNNDYTVAAYELAKSNSVKLINREALIEMILAMNPGTAPEPLVVIAETPVDEMTCPRCGNKLVLRTSHKGQFYGCRSFPKCRHIKQIEAV